MSKIVQRSAACGLLLLFVLTAAVPADAARKKPWEKFKYPQLGEIVFHGNPLRYSGAEPRRRPLAPQLGEHNRELYGQLGLGEDDLRTYVRGILDQCMPGGRFALGAGNTVANYVPLQNYFVMLDEARKWRP